MFAKSNYLLVACSTWDIAYFYFTTVLFKFWWLSNKKMHAVSAGRARINIYHFTKVSMKFLYMCIKNVSTWWNTIVFIVVWEKNTIGSAPTVCIHKEIYSKSCRQFIYRIHKKRVFFFLQFQLQQVTNMASLTI